MLKKIVCSIALSTCVTLYSLSAGAETLSTSGKVVETMNAAGYTYILVDSGARQEWVAIPESPVSVGEVVSYSAGMVMENFHSKSLDRTFPSIMFSSGLVAGQPQTAATPPPAEDNSFAAAVAREQQGGQAAVVPVAESSGGSMGAIVPFTEVKVEKASGENSFTVEELFSNAKDLNGRTIRLRAKVVKVSEAIMGRNWLHLQDGTGNPMNNTHDLVVTTAETVPVDTVVTVEGVLAAGKDFGAGYSYEAIVEQATLITQ